MGQVGVHGIEPIQLQKLSELQLDVFTIEFHFCFQMSNIFRFT